MTKVYFLLRWGAITIIIFCIFIVFIQIVSAVNTEALVQEVAVRQQIVLDNRGQYEYISPVCDSFGCYEVNHIEKWNGDFIPEKVGYHVVYTRNDGAVISEATRGFEYLTHDWILKEPTSTSQSL